MNIVKELEAINTDSSIHPSRRVVIVQREDGLFEFAEQYYYVSRYQGMAAAEGWATLPPTGIYDSAISAEAEARAAFRHWYCVSE